MVTVLLQIMQYAALFSGLTSFWSTLLQELMDTTSFFVSTDITHFLI
jgi:hypothetical protein